MSAYIASRIELAYDENGLEAGQAKYRAFFITTTLWTRYQADTDTILTVDGYEACIVTA